MNGKKEQLEKVCKIRDWSPNQNQLSSILAHFESEIRKGKSHTISDCQGIISTYCPGTKFFFYDGVDNSDLNALLLLAMKKQ